MEKTINRLMIAALVLALFFGGIAFALRNSPHDKPAEGDRYFERCDYINLELQGLDVTVIPYDEEKIRISYKNDLPLTFETGDNSLSVTESNKFVISLFAGRESEFGLYLYLPRSTYRDVSIYTGTGSVTVGKLDCQSLSVLTESGNIICEDIMSMCSLTTTKGFISAMFGYVVSDSAIFSRKGNAEIFLPPNSSVAVDFETDTGRCETDLQSGYPAGSFMYSFNGGDKLIRATMEQGVLEIKER